ncbi:MAG: hypothetical protein WCS73_03280 [Lentisphaeria bacterium]
MYDNSVQVLLKTIIYEEFSSMPGTTPLMKNDLWRKDVKKKSNKNLIKKKLNQKLNPKPMQKMSR